MKKKPCPFCGGTRLSTKKIACTWNDPPFAYAVSCAGLNCHGNIYSLSHDLFETEEQAVEAWNKRATGCTRNQTTTQYCAEVIERDAEIEKLRAESAKLAASNHSYLSNYQEARGEIERLKAGGCARDQTTTQYCAEAVALQSENARLKDAIHDLAKHISRWDWWSLKPETHALVGEKE